MADLRGGVIGCGFFARNHMHAWRQIDGVQVAAVCDADRERAANFQRDFDVAHSYEDARRMLEAEQLDFVDIVTQPASHRVLVELAASCGVPVICQKPMATTFDEAKTMVLVCESAGLPFMVHENFRWQSPMRAMKETSRRIGELFYGRIAFRSAHNVYIDQPYLARDPRFIIADLGVHLLDLARFFLGEATRLVCQTRRVNSGIQGEDVATILLLMESGATCVVEMSYASKLDTDLFPQTLAHLEGSEGSVTLGPHFELTEVIGTSVTQRPVAPALFPWSRPPGQAVQESVLAIQRHWVECLRARSEPETSGRDNLRTLELVSGAYRSAEQGRPYLVSTAQTKDNGL